MATIDRRTRRWRSAAVIGLLLWCAIANLSCSAQAAPTAQPNPAAASAAAPAVVGAPDNTVEKVNIDEIFPPDEGRDLVLSNCTNCHTIVPIALARKTPDEWVSHRTQHRQRVGGISDADADRLWAYLTKNFAPGRPIPQLPEDLLKTWTAY